MPDLPALQRTEIANTRPILQLPQRSSSAVWQGVAEATSQLSEVLERERASADARYLAQLETDIQTKAVELRDQHNHNPAAFQKAWEEYTAGTLSNIPSRVKEEAQISLQQRANQVVNTLNSEKRTRDRGLAIDTLNTRLSAAQNELWAEAYNNGTASPRFLELAGQVENIGQSAVNLGLKTQESADLTVDSMLDRAKTEAAIGSVKALYQEKGSEEALGFLESVARDPEVNLTPAQRDSIVARGTSVVNGLAAKDRALVAEANAEATANYDLEVEKAIINDDIERLNALYAQAEQASFLSPAQQTARQVKILKAQDEVSGSIQDIARVQAQLSGVPLLDPTDTNDIKKANTYFERTLFPKLSGESFETQVSQTLDFVRKTNVVPDALKRQLVGGLAAGSPEIKANTADQIVQIVEEAPFTKRAFNEQTIGTAFHISDLRRAGVNPEEAVRQAEEAAKVSEPVLQMRTQIAREDKHLNKNASYLKERSEIFGFFNDIDVPQEMLAEYNDIQHRMYKRTGNFDASQRAAWSSLKNVWGVTEIGVGGKRWQKFAPEDYNPFEGDGEWMKGQLLGDVQKQFLLDPKKGDLNDRLMLLPDNQTARDAGAGVMPSWPVWMLDDDGIAKPLINENGTPQRWKPDFKGTDIYRQHLQEQEELMNFNLQELRQEYLTKKKQSRVVQEWHGNVSVSPSIGDD